MVNVSLLLSGHSSGVICALIEDVSTTVVSNFTIQTTMTGTAAHGVVSSSIFNTSILVLTNITINGSITQPQSQTWGIVYENGGTYNVTYSNVNITLAACSCSCPTNVTCHIY